MSVTDTDRGFRQMTIRVRGVKAMKLTVGIHENVATYTPYASGSSIGTVAAAHEFGLGVPQRSWLRGWFDEHGKPAFTRQIRDTLVTALEGGDNVAAALQHQGEYYVAEIQERMDAHISPTLAASTVSKKERTGSPTPGTPLEDTHIMRNSLESRVK